MAILFPKLHLAKSSYFSAPIFSAQLISSIPQKWEIHAPKRMRVAAMTIPFVATRYGSVIVPGPRIATIRVKIELLMPPAMNFLSKYVTGNIIVSFTFSKYSEFRHLFRLGLVEFWSGGIVHVLLVTFDQVEVQI